MSKVNKVWRCEVKFRHGVFKNGESEIRHGYGVEREKTGRTTEKEMARRITI